MNIYTYVPACGDDEAHDGHEIVTAHFKNAWCSGLCLCGSTHPDIPQGPHSPGEHK